jgi:hypothetical protein
VGGKGWGGVGGRKWEELLGGDTEEVGVWGSRVMRACAHTYAFVCVYVCVCVCLCAKGACSAGAAQRPATSRHAAATAVRADQGG